MEYNSCAHLVDESVYSEAETLYNKLLSEGIDPGQYMLDLQLKTQEKLDENFPDRKVNPSKIETVGELYDWTVFMKTAYDDEFSELVSALPGINTPVKERTAVWKKWKSSYEDIRNKKVSDLTENELLELLFEKIDMVHFDLGIDLGLKLNAKTKFILYVIKNLENIRRYNAGY